jgi:CRP-like cAMP-binding protein
VALLDALDLFTGAPRSTLERLAAHATDVHVPAGAVILREGDTADALFVLCTGDVAVSAHGEGARNRRLRTMTGPSYFGEIGLLRSLPRTATVMALTPAELLRVEADDFFDALQGASVSASLLARSTARLARTHPRLSETSPLDLTQPQQAPAAT